MFLPELVQAGNMVARTMEKIKPHLAGGPGSKRKALVMLATVEGDVHDIGKNLVNLLPSASGYEVIDLGKDVPTRVIVEKVNQLSPDILGLSALLSTTMPAQQQVIHVLEETGIREKVKYHRRGGPRDPELGGKNRRGWICGGCILRRQRGRSHHGSGIVRAPATRGILSTQRRRPCTATLRN